FASLAGQDLQLFQGRCVDGAEAIGPIDAARGVDQPLARNHRFGQVIAKALERSRLDTLRVAHVDFILRSRINPSAPRALQRAWRCSLNPFSARAGTLVAPPRLAH